MQIFKNLIKYEEKKFFAYENKYTYKVINSSVNYLVEKIFNKTTVNSKILIIGENNIFTYIAILASLKSGRTYIPLSINDSKSRIINISKIIKPKIILSSFNNFKFLGNFIKLDKKILKENYSLKKQKERKNNLAYIIFTSGSTGKPKGVCISRSSLDHYLNWYQKTINPRINYRCSQIPQIGFDLSVADILGNFNSGGNIFPLNTKYYNFFPGEFLNDNKINHLVCVPSFIDLLYKSRGLRKKNLRNLKSIYFCGELLHEAQVKKIYKINKNIRIINSYGPTEATVSCSEIEINFKNYKKYSLSGISIGRPIKGMKFLIINKKKNKRIKKIGVEGGELIILGPQVAEGYYKNKIENFKFKKLRKYKAYYTGDIVFKFRNNYYFKSRKDNQIKKNGYRIELNEIDLLVQNEKIAERSLSFFKKNKILTFLYNSKVKNKDKVLKILAKFLPKYALPDGIILINHIPTNFNGKIDYKKLLMFNEKKNFK